MRCELSKICIVPADCSPGGMGLRKREALRGDLPDLCRAGTGSGPRIHNSELICRAGLGLRDPHEISYVFLFLTGQQVAPEEDICTKYVLRYRLLERIPCLEIRVLGHCTFCTKNECSSLDSVSQSVLADPITSRGSEHELNEL